MLLHCGGMQLQDIYFTLKGDLSKYDDAEKALTQYFQPNINIPFERTCLGMRVKEMTKQSSNSLRV